MIEVYDTDARGPKAIEIVSGRGQWLRCRSADGRKAYGVPSQQTEGLYYLTTRNDCTCPDFKYNGLTPSRIGVGGAHFNCKHILAVRLHCELAREGSHR